MNNRQLVKRISLLALFLAIQAIFFLTPLGFIPIGPLRATTMHIPVIIGAQLMGVKFGAILGFCFGLFSLLINTFQPTITSFVFSPFVSIGGQSGNFFSLIIVFVPRILLGVVSAILFKAFKNKSIPLASILSAVLSTFLHSALVLSLIAVLFTNAYATAKGIPAAQLVGLFITVLSTNGILEIIIAAILCPIITNTMLPILKRKSFYD